jgi:uncharacterized protein
VGMKTLSRYAINIRCCQNIPYWEINDPCMQAENVVIYLHGFSSSIEENLASVTQFASQGFTVIGIDARLHGIRKSPEENSPGAVPGYFEKSRLMIDTCMDVIKLIDHRASMPGANGDGLQIGVFGVSMGGMMAYLLSSMDKRISAIAPTLSTPDWLAKMRWAKRCLNRKKIDPIRRINPIRNIDRIFPTPMIIQNGSRDKVIPIEYTERYLPVLRKLYAGTGDRLVYIRHDCGHELTTTMVQNAIGWFRKIMA